MNFPLTLQDVRSTEKENRNSNNSIPIDMGDFQREACETILKHARPVNIGGSDVSILDLFSIPIESEQAIKDFIQNRLNIDIESPKAIEKINEMFQTALDFYQNRYFRTLPIHIKRKKFKSIDDVVKFLKETRDNTATAKIHCMIAKVCYAVDGVLNHPKIENSGLLVQNFIERYFQPPFKIKPLTRDEYGNSFTSGYITIVGKKINFDFIARQKQPASIIGKQLADVKYDSVDDFTDLIGGTFYLKSDEDAAILMQYIYGGIYQGENVEISNKNGIDPNIVRSGNGLNKQFHQALKAATKIGKTKIDEGEKIYTEIKASTSPDYKDIKLKGHTQVPRESGPHSSTYPIGTELKFVIGGHDNEQGITLQNIYDYAKRFRELTRLGIPIRDIDIVKYVNDFFENIDQILAKKNKQKNTYYQELFQDLVSKGCIDISQAIDDSYHIQGGEAMKSFLKHLFSDWGTFLQQGGRLLKSATTDVVEHGFVQGETLLQDLHSIQQENTQKVMHRFKELGMITFGKKRVPEFNEKILSMGLFQYYKTMLIPVKVPPSQQVYFFDKNILNLSQTGIYTKVEQV